MTPPGPEAQGLLPAGTDAARCWWASKETIAASEYSLSAGRYKPQVAEAISEEDPAELISEALTLEREIAEGLENLLREVEVV